MFMGNQVSDRLIQGRQDVHLTQLRLAQLGSALQTLQAAAERADLIRAVNVDLQPKCSITVQRHLTSPDRSV